MVYNHPRTPAVQETIRIALLRYAEDNLELRAISKLITELQDIESFLTSEAEKNADIERQDFDRTLEAEGLK